MSETKRKQLLTLYGTNTDYSVLRDNLEKVKSMSAGKVTNSLDIINIAVAQYIQSGVNEPKRREEVDQKCKKEQLNEPLVVTSFSALNNLVKIVSSHETGCRGSLVLKSDNPEGLSKSCDLSCDTCTIRRKWKSSLDMPGGKDFVSMKLTHGFLTSGILQCQFDRLSSASGIGTIPIRTVNESIKGYSEIVHNEREASCRRALSEEQTFGDRESDSGSVDIITDARHSTRRNSKFTDVVCIGYGSHKVIDHVTVSREDDPCAQRHELNGTKRIYEKFETKGIKVRRHGHDRNASINKYVRVEQPNTVNQNDTWHVSVSIEKELKKISSGAKCREGKTWSQQLVDKVKPVKTHFQYAMRNCNGDADVLQKNLLNIVDHYKNIHDSCSSDSRCKVDRNYIPSREILTESVAISLLTQMIMSTDVFKHPHNYVYAMDTCYVESFNNVINMFHDKRIGSFGQDHYRLRSDLAICHWNENSGKKKNTYQYRDNIWARLICRLYPTTIWRPY